VVLDQNDPEGLGRVKVRFHWDHTGHSSTWVRVLQQWAGAGGIGAQFIPRPGSEVLVGFIENRIDLPYLMGCFYNGKQKPVFDLPANLTQSGWQSAGKGGLSHHLFFEDKGGGEKIDLHSGRDLVRSTDRDDTAFVKRHQEVWAKGIDIAAGESIRLHVGRSSIVVTDAGVWIDAPHIHLNSGNAPDTFAPELQPPLPAKPVGPGGPAAAAAVAGGTGKALASGKTAGGKGHSTHGDALAKKLVKPGGSATQADVDAVVGELKKLPEPALKTLDANHVKVIAAKGSVTDFAKDLKGVQPRGWPPGATWDKVPGAYLPDRNAVVIATAGTGANLHVPGTGEGHGSVNMVVHEATHAIDAHGGGSKAAAFLAARTKDLGALSAYERQAGVAGPSETFAESAARFYGGSHGSIVTPALDGFWRAHPLGGK
jgi:hypothetical protein